MEQRPATVEELDMSAPPLRILINGNLGYIGPVVVAHLRRVALPNPAWPSRRW